MATIHQSDISSWIRCPTAFKYNRQGLPRRQSSALAYGSVMHYAMEVFTRLRTAGSPLRDATAMAQESFSFYWNPVNIDAICDPVDTWLPRQSYASLRKKGLQAIADYAELTKFDDFEVLGTEFGFQVPIPGTWDYDLGEPHILAGTVDRLAVRHYSAVETVCIDDFKTGKEYPYLRQNMQFTAYCMASTQREFWVGWRGEDGFGPDRGEELYQRFTTAPRRAQWINLRDLKFQDAGWRGPDDYTRFALAVDQLQMSIAADIYPLNLSGETCTYCEFASSCAGVGVPDKDHGAPGK